MGMSKIKEYDRALYGSNFEAIKSFIDEGQLPNYSFGVCSMEAFNRALTYLCLNDIPHSYTYYGEFIPTIITLTWEDGNYTFWCEYKEED
jgi:hypothetical protein